MAHLSTNSYARAFQAIASKTPEKKIPLLCTALWHQVKRNGDWSKRNAIIEAIANLIREKTQTHTLQITTAREISKKEIDALTTACAKNLAITNSHTTIDEHLIAGVELILDNQYAMDFSARRLIQEVFTQH